MSLLSPKTAAAVKRGGLLVRAAKAPKPKPTATLAVAPFTMPTTIGGMADALYITRNARLAMQKLVAELDERETQIENMIIDTLPKSDQTQGAGKLARVGIKKSVKPIVEDWAKLYAHIKRTGHFELMQKRLGEPAVQERWDAGKPVPGVGEFNVIKVTVNKL